MFQYLSLAYFFSCLKTTGYVIGGFGEGSRHGNVKYELVKNNAPETPKAEVKNVITDDTEDSMEYDAPSIEYHDVAEEKPKIESRILGVGAEPGLIKKDQAPNPVKTLTYKVLGLGDVPVSQTKTANSPKNDELFKVVGTSGRPINEQLGITSCKSPN